eukprot:361324-Chlamydomonas_euryale.AAC.1
MPEERRPWGHPPKVLSDADLSLWMKSLTAQRRRVGKPSRASRVGARGPPGVPGLLGWPHRIRGKITAHPSQSPCRTPAAPKSDAELTGKFIRALLHARAAREGADGCGAGVSRPRADCASTPLATPRLIRAARRTTRIELRPTRPPSDCPRTSVRSRSACY